jgi:hypothetical protein
MIYTFSAVKGSLMAWGAQLRRSGVSQFSDLVGNPIVFKNVDGTMTATLMLQGQPYFYGDRVPDTHLGETTLSGFEGDYHSDELEVTYGVSLVKGTLKLKNGDNPAVDLNPVAPNEFQAGDLGTVVFDTTNDRHVSGLTLFSQRARGITFQKVD